MTAYLLTWNPQSYQQEDFQETLNSQDGKMNYACGNTKSIKAGDRVFLLRQQVDPRGIIAYGYAISSTFEDKHWNYQKSEEGKRANYIKVNFDFINFEEKPIFEISELKKIFPDQHWNPQSSGILLKEEYQAELEKLLEEKHIKNYLAITEEETDTTEGGKKHILQTQYERNPNNRRKCIEHWGYSCFICGFNFEENFGKIGKGFIHVHHENPVSEGGERKTDPVNDMKPLCPNCHAMIHLKKPCFSIQEIKDFLKN